MTLSAFSPRTTAPDSCCHVPRVPPLWGSAPTAHHAGPGSHLRFSPTLRAPGGPRLEFLSLGNHITLCLLFQLRGQSKAAQTREASLTEGSISPSGAVLYRPNVSSSPRQWQKLSPRAVSGGRRRGCHLAVPRKSWWQPVTSLWSPRRCRTWVLQPEPVWSSNQHSLLTLSHNTDHLTSLKTLPMAEMWMGLETVTQSEESQKEKTKYRILTHTCGI